MSNSLSSLSDDYIYLLQKLTEQIRNAQIRAALSVNNELVLLYWHIGQEILLRQQQQGWGAKVIDQLAQDLRREFPTMKGFSSRNLKYMRAFAEAWPDRAIVQQLVAQLPWGHNVRLLEHTKSLEQISGR
jgi:predicted nuclease of restriction endonuclease-like (RecB) superfamily